MFCRQTLQMLIKSVDNKCKRIEGEGGREVMEAIQWEGGDGPTCSRHMSTWSASSVCVPTIVSPQTGHSVPACRLRLRATTQPRQARDTIKVAAAARRPPRPDGRPAQSTGEIQSREKSSSRIPTGKALIKI